MRRLWVVGSDVAVAGWQSKTPAHHSESQIYPDRPKSKKNEICFSKSELDTGTNERESPKEGSEECCKKRETDNDKKVTARFHSEI